MSRSPTRALLPLALVLAGCARYFDEEPRITGVSPTSGPLAGGTAISIQGANFDRRTKVFIGGAPAASVAFNATGAMTATTPPGVALGAVDVTIKNDNGLSDTLRKGFTYSNEAASVTVSTVSPASGTGATSVTITGANFQANATVTFGGASATNVVVTNATTITCTTPATGSGAVDVVVRNPDGGSGTLAKGFTYPGGTTTTGPSKTITAFAGTGTPGSGGDGGLATQAQLNGPRGVALASDGSLYVADTENHRIRRVDTAGTIVVFAGAGTAGFAGDNGAAGSAQLNRPQGIAIDANGNTVYVADTGNHCVRAITNNVITTFAGKGTQAGTTGDGGNATDALLNGPQAVAVDGSRNVFVVDTNNHRVRRVDFATKKIGPFAGTGTAGFAETATPTSATAAALNAPSGIAIDAQGLVYVADTGNNRVRKIDAQGLITTFAGGGTTATDGGPAAQALLASPVGIAFDSGGGLLIAEEGAHKVRLVAAGNLTISTLAGTGTGGSTGDGGPATSALLSAPRGVVANATAIYVADTGNSRVRQLK